MGFVNMKPSPIWPRAQCRQTAHVARLQFTAIRAGGEVSEILLCSLRRGSFINKLSILPDAPMV